MASEFGEPKSSVNSETVRDGFDKASLLERGNLTSVDGRGSKGGEGETGGEEEGSREVGKRKILIL